MTTKTAKTPALESKFVLVKTDIVSFLQALETHIKAGFKIDYSDFLAAQSGCCTATLVLES
jgi:hypothetical protein